MSNMKSATSLLGKDDGEQVEELQLRELIPFAEHPFQVREDDSLATLMDSIACQGVSVPVIVRPKGRGTFEIIAGHRRCKACELLGLESVPAFIRDLDDEEAVLSMVDTNIQRESLLPSEKAFAYKMKLEALSKTLEKMKAEGITQLPQRSRERLAQNTEDSSVQIQRYIRLTHLIPSLLQAVDQKKLPFQTGVELSYLKEYQQQWLQVWMEEQGRKPSLTQATQIKEASQQESFTQQDLLALLEPKTVAKKLSLKADMSQYFPEGTTSVEMEEIIVQLLEQWMKGD